MVLNKDSSISPLLAAFFIIISLSGCFSHWQGDMAKLVISFGGAERAANYRTDDAETHQRLEHKIVLSNKRETVDFKHTGTETFESYVAPGNWTVWVYSWLEDDVYAAGTIEANLQAGNDNILIIPMYQAHLVRFDSQSGGAVPDQVVFHEKNADEPSPPKRGGYSFGGWYADAGLKTPYDFNNPVTGKTILYAKWTGIDVPGNSLAAELSWLSANAVDGGGYIFSVDKDEALAPQNLSYSGKKISITLKGDTQERIIRLSGNGSLFTINSGVTLILDNNITLKGLASNNASLIMINNGGMLVMNAGIISGNTAQSGGGVGVYQGSFTMNGGEISGNTTIEYGGGGVSVTSGIFTMSGGEISGNTTAEHGGGGVSISSGIFTMSGGEISGNKAGSSGGGVGVWKGSFIMSGGEISGNTTKYEGGGVNIYGNETSFEMKGGTISGNKAGTFGGGVNVVGGTFTMTDGDIHDNEVVESGGGVNVMKESTYTDGDGKEQVVSAGTFTMSGGNISGNTAQNNGGGIYVEGKFTKEAIGGTISGNKVRNGEGKAVFAWRVNGDPPKRDSDVLPNEALSFDGTTDSPIGGVWND